MQHQLLKITGLIILFSLVQNLYAQIVPVQNQYLVNPYIYNPAWAGQSDYIQFNLGFKKQWLNIEGSPTVSTLTFELPTSGKLSFAANIVNVTEGPLNDLSTMLTTSYRLPMGDGEEHFLSFGLSLGFRYNGLNMGKIDDPNDPAIIQIAQNKFLPDGGFGLAYQNKNLQIGFSMPRFVGSQALSSSKLSGSTFLPWAHFIGTASYRFELGMSNIDITPTVLFHYEKDFTSQLEGALKVAYLQKYWLGGSFRQDYGATIFVGANLSNMFSLGYYYTFSAPTARIPNDNHEIGVRIRIGDKKRGNVLSVSTLNDIPYENIEEQEVVITEDLFEVDSTVSFAGYNPDKEIQLEKDMVVYGLNEKGEEFELESDNYLIIGTYSSMYEAKESISKMQQKNITPLFIRDGNNNLYYLYLHREKDLDKARRITNQFQKLKGFEQTKLLILK